jgi:hypothetical protein
MAFLCPQSCRCFNWRVRCSKDMSLPAAHFGRKQHDSADRYDNHLCLCRCCCLQLLHASHCFTNRCPGGSADEPHESAVAMRLRMRLMTLSCRFCSMALIAHLLQQRGSNVLVAVVPQSPAPSGQASQAQLSPQKGSATLQHHDRQTGHTPAEAADFSRLHALGTAARVLRLSRSAQVAT